MIFINKYEILYYKIKIVIRLTRQNWILNEMHDWKLYNENCRCKSGNDPGHGDRLVRSGACIRCINYTGHSSRRNSLLLQTTRSNTETSTQRTQYAGPPSRQLSLWVTTDKFISSVFFLSFFSFTLTTHLSFVAHLAFSFFFIQSGLLSNCLPLPFIEVILNSNLIIFKAHSPRLNERRKKTKKIFQ